MKKFILLALFSLLFVGFKGYEKPPDKAELATACEVELQAADLAEVVRLDGVELRADRSPILRGAATLTNISYLKTEEVPTRERDLRIFYSLKNQTLNATNKYGRAEKDPGNTQIS